MLDFYFKAPSVVSNAPNIDWTAVAAIVAAFALLTTWWLFFHSKREQRSLFYLNQIKSYFTQATSLLSVTDNSNVNWHQAIELLKMADNLIGQLKDKAHQHICVMEMMNTGFQIINIIKDIDDFRFFYGVPDYKAKDSASLFQQTNPQFFETPTLRIAPTALSCLCAFIDKVNRIFHESELNVPYHLIFKRSYFNVSIKNSTISGFTEITMKVVMEYIKDSKKHKAARTQRVLTEEIDT
ncbi:TPA: hypothetical protein JBH76_04955 [Legionella pneumophila]|nr:hypothetical protein [Legionella pneumophila]MDW8907136.1 hypothetical protein [Legionella pneumophila]HAT3883351.1 hypothetical protein [Legionella pneumophila]HAT8334910.1 hypothetical protein [Legionella pneumophila]HAU0969538.1 hypothetical protein [Legionella pneumophila]